MISLPSNLIYLIDIPEPTQFQAQFFYNFFVKDETTKEDSELPKSLREKSSIDGNKKLQNIIDFKVPRFVKFNWANIWHDSSPATSQILTENKNIISNNIDKILSEDQLSTFTFASISFHDIEADQRLFMNVSASLDILTQDLSVTKDLSTEKLTKQLTNLLETNVDHDEIINALMTLNDHSEIVASGKPVKNSILETIKKFDIHAQFNTALLNDLVADSVANPFSQHNGSVYELLASAEQIKQFNSHAIDISDEEFSLNIPIIDAQASDITVANQKAATIVGYVIEKQEMLPDGALIQHPSIIIENPFATSAYDFRIKYGKKYIYSIKSIALYKLPALNQNNKTSFIKFLVSSKLVSKTIVECVENIAPPPPCDIKPVWNYQDGKLSISWCFPTNSQRDIKKFQIFRRKSISDAFELLKVYDFNDAETQVEFEKIPSQLVTKFKSPFLNYIDEEFKKNSKFIYTLCSIDAHGLTSCYGAQFEVSFDQIKNSLILKLVSHSGAPKQYPNCFLAQDAFEDTIRVNGGAARTAKVYFTPTYFSIKDDMGNKKDIVQTAQLNGKYKFTLLNLDNQGFDSVDITIDDRANRNDTNLTK